MEIYQGEQLLKIKLMKKVIFIVGLIIVITGGSLLTNCKKAPPTNSKAGVILKNLKDSIVIDTNLLGVKKMLSTYVVALINSAVDTTTFVQLLSAGEDDSLYHLLGYSNAQVQNCKSNYLIFRNSIINKYGNIIDSCKECAYNSKIQSIHSCAKLLSAFRANSALAEYLTDVSQGWGCNWWELALCNSGCIELFGEWNPPLCIACITYCTCKNCDHVPGALPCSLFE